MTEANVQRRNPLRLVGLAYMIAGWAMLALALIYPSHLRLLTELLSRLAVVDWIPWLRADASSLQRALGADAVLAYVGTKVAAALVAGLLLVFCACFSVYRAARFGDLPRISNVALRRCKPLLGLLVIAALPFMPLLFLDADDQLHRVHPAYWRIYVGMFVTLGYLLIPCGLLMVCLGPDVGYPDSPSRGHDGNDHAVRMHEGAPVSP